MSLEYIPENNEVKFYPETISATLPLSKENFGFEKVRNVAQEKNLNEKIEIHSTIIGFDQGKEIAKHFENLSVEEKHQKLKQIESILQSAHFEVTPLDEFYLIEKDEEITFNSEVVMEHRESLIQLLEIKCGDIHNKLSDICGFTLEPTFPHVTLFTNSNIESRKLRGIGIYSEKDFNEIEKMKLSL